MNLIALVAAAIILDSATHDSPRDTRVSAAIEYTSVDRSGNVLTVSVSSGDPYYGQYYGRDEFYYRDRHYYRYPPRDIVCYEPVYVVRDRHDDHEYWKAVREHDKRWAKVEIERDKRWAKVAREREKSWSKGNNGKGKGRKR